MEYSWLVEISATWGIRKMLKVISGKVLPRIEQRVTIDVPKELHFLHSRARGRPLEFVALISNPTPLAIWICGREITISYNDAVLAIEKDNTRIQIPKETLKHHVTLAIYRPLMHPVGLPSKNESWKLEGTLKLRCYYGEWSLPIKTGYFAISGDWQEAKEHVAQIRKELTS
jgi:hypothetical protein